MLIDKSLIEKFLKKNCTAEEAKQVHQYLTDHPEILQEYYQHDWDEASKEAPFNSEHADRMYKAINDRLQVRKTGFIKYMSWAAAAAVIVIGSLWLYKTNKGAEKTPATIATKERTVQQDPTAGGWQQQRNTTNSIMKIKLPDGSRVFLSPEGSLKYATVFQPGKRDIYLQGEALFEVVKDKTRPFTVYSGSLSTTALGTSFRVTTKPAAIRVQLLTGKVVVRSITQSLPGWKKDIYLLPGQQINYDATACTVQLSGSGIDKAPAIAEAALPKPAKEMIFDNTPLPQVLNKLALHNKVSIIYKSEELDGLTFSGTIYYSDSLPAILQVIARMNNLSLTAVQEGFCIKKTPGE